MKTIPLFKVAMSETVRHTVPDVLQCGFIGEGLKVKEFEAALSERVNNPYCLALSSGTHGLTLALRLINKQKGSWGRVSNANVISTPLTCFASNAPIITGGYNIVWADIQKDSLNIDPSSIREKITNETKAIVVVHWGGYPCDMDEIKKISDDYGISVIEDGAHAFGSFYKGYSIGSCSHSDFCMISFQAIKHLTCGDGGVLFSNNLESHIRGRHLRWFGINRESSLQDMRCREDILEAGFKFHMNDICATIGLSNLLIVDENLRIAKRNSDYYKEAMSGLSEILPIQNKTDRVSSNWLFTVLVEDRTGFARKMGEKGIMVSQVHSRNDKHICTEAYADNFLPVMDEIDSKYCCIPVGWWVSKEDREYIVSTIREGW